MVSKYTKSEMKHSVLFDRALANGLKIGYLDIETSPYLVWTYPLKDAYISSDQIEQTLRITSIVLLEEGQKNPEVFQWRFDPIRKQGDDRLMLSQLAKKLNNFDVIVMQNGDNYDIKVLQERLLQHKLPPMTNILTIDTLKLSRRSFKKSSHSLDTRSREYNFGGKDKQGMSDCIAVARGDRKRQKRRIAYNIKDVIDTRKVFLRELDYYDLDRKTIRFFQSFAHTPKVCCARCAHNKQKKFDIETINKKNKRTKLKEMFYKCKNCLHIWKVK